MPEDNQRRVFVLMPFREEFDDVYDMVKAVCKDLMVGLEVECLRADEIDKPGVITDQIIEHIRDADAIVADLTGSNPNVMYELGYAHALGRPAIIINQSVEKSPFDVAGMRQIVYDRNRLAKDCRPRLVTSLTEILGNLPAVEINELPQEPVEVKRGRPAVAPHPLIVSDRLIAQVQSIHLKMQLGNTMGNVDEIRRLAAEVLSILDRIPVGDAPATATIDLRNFVGTVGNCAVELEKGELFREAEDIWKRAIGLMPSHGGVHFQYGDFLIDRGRVEEATQEAKRARELSPNDPRIQRLEMKIALVSGKVDDGIGEKMRQNFEKDPSNSQAATSYLMFLARSGADLQLFESVCLEWQKALPADKKHIATRALADHLAESEQYDRAREMYETILDNLTGEERVHVLHNIAIVYDELNMQEKAEASWREAYTLNSSNSTIQAAFSQRLANWGKLDMAVKVASGLPIT